MEFCGQFFWSFALRLPALWCVRPACLLRSLFVPASAWHACLAACPLLVVGLGQLSLPFLCPLCRPVRQSRLSAADWVSRYLTASLQHLRERTLVATRLVLVRLLWMLGCVFEHSVSHFFFWFWFCFLLLAPSCWASSAVLASAVQRRQRARSRAAQSLACLLPCVKY